MRRVNTTIPGYWEAAYDKALTASGLEPAEFVRTALYEYVHKSQPNQTAVTKIQPSNSEHDLYMKSSPEHLKQLHQDAFEQVCIRGQEIGEDHVIAPGQLYAWFKFGRDSQPTEWVKNGKLCKDCHTIAKAMWSNGDYYF